MQWWKEPIEVGGVQPPTHTEGTKARHSQSHNDKTEAGQPVVTVAGKANVYIVCTLLEVLHKLTH